MVLDFTSDAQQAEERKSAFQNSERKKSTSPIDAQSRAGQRTQLLTNNFFGNSNNKNEDQQMLNNIKTSPSPKAITNKRNITPVPFGAGANRNQIVKATPEKQMPAER